MVYENRGYDGEANKQVRLNFYPGGDSVVVDLNKDETTIDFSKVLIGNKVRLTVTDVYGTVNNGIKNLEFYGSTQLDGAAGKK